MKRPVIAAILLSGTAMPAYAHDAADHADDIIVTASRMPLQARQIGSAVTVISNEDLRREQIIFVKNALQDMTGLQVSSDRPGDNTNLSIRGSDNDQVLWLIDGIKLGDPSSTSTQFQPTHLTSTDIARIEVLRGNQSSLYGSDAIGGVVNIITQRATEEGISVNAEGEAGSHGTVNGGASILGKSGALDYRLTATGYSHDGPSLADPRTAAPPGSVQEKDGYWRYGFSGRMGIAATDSLSFQLIGLWQDSHTDLDGTTTDNFDTVRNREYAAAAQTAWVSADGRFRADGNVSRFVSRRLYFGANNAPEGDLYKGFKDAANVNLSYDGQFWSVAAGGSLERERTTQVTNYSGDFREKVSTKSAYGELALKPIDNLTITGAARIDDNSRFGEFDTYRGTVAYVIPGALGADSLKFRASYGTGAKAPGLYQLFDPRSGNPDLKVETSRGGDVGIDIIVDRLSASFSYFFAKTRNEIVYDNSRQPTAGYVQFGRTRKSGIEIDLSVEPLPGLLRIRQSYTYLNAESDPQENGNFEDMGRPASSGSTSVTLTPTDSLSITARARYRSRNASNFGGRVTSGFTVFDLLASYAITERIEIYGRVQNLFDRQYQMSYGKNALGASAYGGVRVNF